MHFQLAIQPQRPVPVASLPGDDDLDDLAQQFVAMITEQSLGLLVDQHDPAFHVGNDHGIGGRFEELPEQVVGSDTIGLGRLHRRNTLA